VVNDESDLRKVLQHTLVKYAGRNLTINQACHGNSKRYFLIPFICAILAQLATCSTKGITDSEPAVRNKSQVTSESSNTAASSQQARDNNNSSTKRSTADKFPLPILPDRIDFAVGTTAPQQLHDLASNEAAVILLSDQDCSLCDEMRSTLTPVLEASGLALKIADNEIASLIQSDNAVSLQFVAANGIIVAREVLSVDGAFDISRLSWLANATQSISSVPISAMKPVDESQDKFAVVTDQVVSLYSTDTGKPIETILSGEKFEGAWSLGDNVYGISECCEPAAGRLWMVDSGEPLNRDGAAFDATSARLSPDNNWILTVSSSTKIWPSVKPFSSSPTEVLPPGSTPMAVEWLHDRFGLAALWRESDTRAQAAIEVVGLSTDLQIGSRDVFAVPSATVAIAPLNDGTIALAISGTNPSLMRLHPLSGKIEKLLTLPDAIKSTSLSQSGKKLLMLTEKGQVTVLDTENWREIISVHGPFKSANW